MSILLKSHMSKVNIILHICVLRIGKSINENEHVIRNRSMFNNTHFELRNAVYFELITPPMRTCVCMLRSFSYIFVTDILNSDIDITVFVYS